MEKKRGVSILSQSLTKQLQALLLLPVIEDRMGIEPQRFTQLILRNLRFLSVSQVKATHWTYNSWIQPYNLNASVAGLNPSFASGPSLHVLGLCLSLNYTVVHPFHSIPFFIYPFHFQIPFHPSSIPFFFHVSFHSISILPLSISFHPPSFIPFIPCPISDFCRFNF